MQRRRLTGWLAKLARMATESPRARQRARERERENEELKGRRKLDKNHKSFESCERRSSSAKQPATAAVVVAAAASLATRRLRVCHCIVLRLALVELARPALSGRPGSQLGAVTMSEVRSTPLGSLPSRLDGASRTNRSQLERQ